MSELMPEVGDLWEVYVPNAGTFKAIVINTTEYKHHLCITDDFQTCFLWKYTTENYLGKSKANINELFEVEDEFKS